WSAVVPPALWAAVLAYRRQVSGQADAEPEEGVVSTGVVPIAQLPHGADALHRLALLWFVVSFGLITYSVTKYYHYLVPCLPPLAIVIGIWLHRLMPTPARDLQTADARASEQSGD